ncbi:hypothetical protein M7I_3159 [Glarea lozoyensis 74030]|uniref:Uncharacterized protein n=1 Tax=Glarea lozoyensis (strain ATCC 74030 / MF5533) TaxID=1104152 RepID=H0EKS9_GLAL7|nr:hypothetical protein M7I_3159 [Glarea lozoyensis 74030]
MNTELGYDEPVSSRECHLDIDLIQISSQVMTNGQFVFRISIGNSYEIMRRLHGWEDYLEAASTHWTTVAIQITMIQKPKLPSLAFESEMKSQGFQVVEFRWTAFPFAEERGHFIRKINLGNVVITAYRPLK